MDKITHQVRAEHWARILNECMNSGMPKTAWCPGKRDLWETIFLLAAHPAPGSLWSISESVPACSYRGGTVICRSAVCIFCWDQTSCRVIRRIIRFPSGSCDPERETCPGDLEFSWITHLDSGRFTLLPVIQICGAALTGWHPLWNSTSSWTHTKRISSSCSAEGAVTASKDLYGKETDSFFFTKGWSLAASAGPVQKKRHWRSRRNNTGRWCKDWRLYPDTRSRKCSPAISFDTLCKTEKFKNLFQFANADTVGVIHIRVSCHSFN